MGVTYKLRDEVVHFILSQRESNPLASCRQLAEDASQKFGLNLSKSSVHDVLKESGIISPRGRKPKDKFEIPQEKKKQIQESLSQIKLLPDPVEPQSVIASEAKQSFKEITALPAPKAPSVILNEVKDLDKINSIKDSSPLAQNDNNLKNDDTKTSPEYEGAGRVFLKAALWDLGVYAEENIKTTDWDYYLTYSKGIKVVLENNKDFFIDLRLPLERCIREVADGLINNIKPFIVSKVSDEELFKACMDAQTGSKIESILIVDHIDHILTEFSNIMDIKRLFSLENRLFVESNEISAMKRQISLFFPQIIENIDVMNNIMNIKGFDAINDHENVVKLLISDSYENKILLQQAADKLNKMFIADEQGRLLKVSVIARSEATKQSL